MKKTGLLLAGIIAATILVVMGLGILLTGSFYFMPSITVDSFSGKDIDGNGMLVLTGTTNLGLNTHLLVNVSAGPGQAISTDRGSITGIAPVLLGSGGRNTWKAALDLSSLPPGDYVVTVTGVTLSGKDWKSAPGSVAVTKQFRLGNERAGENRSLSAPFIAVNPPDTRATGETIAISGTTNLPPGTSILWNVYRGQCPGNRTEPAGVVPGPLLTGSTAVTGGTAGVNRWLLVFNSSGIAPGCYRIHFAGETLAGAFSEKTAELVLSDTVTRGPPGPSRFITIDTLPNLVVNSRVVITGTTSLPADDELRVEISPLVRGGYDFVVNPNDMSQGAMFAGVAGTAVVVGGDGGINLWSMDFDTYRLPPGNYGVNVSNSRVNRTTFRTEPGDVTAAGTFTVRGGDS